MERITDIKKLRESILANTPDAFANQVSEAINFAQLYHQGETRYSGENFAIHALNTGQIASEIRLDTASVIAAILHQVASRRHKSEIQISTIKGEIQSLFGDDVLDLINQVEHINDATKINKESNPKVLRKYLLSSSDDIRPLLIKICDIQEEILTVESIPLEKVKPFCKKVLEIYSPLCEYLNLNEVKKDLDERAFKILNPDGYDLVTKLLEDNSINDALKESYLKYLKLLANVLGYKVEIKGRIKSKYSTYQKLSKYLKEGKGSKLAEIRDILAFSVITNNINECYSFCEALKTFTVEIPELFDDYITHPKPNGYKAMQMTSQISEISKMFVEIQILTDEMYYFNTYGPASHIAYKASKARFAKSSKDLDWIEKIHKSISEHVNLREKRFSIPITGEIFKNQIFVFTPKGLLIELEKGDTVIDFAYRVHTELGHKTVSARVNGKPAPLNHNPDTGDVIELIIDKKKVTPNADWLKFANSTSTKHKISVQLKRSLEVARK